MSILSRLVLKVLNLTILRRNKMSKTQAETVIKNIIREIVQECTTRGQIVSETLVAFTVNFE